MVLPRKSWNFFASRFFGWVRNQNWGHFRYALGLPSRSRYKKDEDARWALFFSKMPKKIDLQVICVWKCYVWISHMHCNFERGGGFFSCWLFFGDPCLWKAKFEGATGVGNTKDCFREDWRTLGILLGGITTFVKNTYPDRTLQVERSVFKRRLWMNHFLVILMGEGKPMRLLRGSPFEDATGFFSIALWPSRFAWKIRSHILVTLRFWARMILCRIFTRIGMFYAMNFKIGIIIITEDIWCPDSGVVHLGGFFQKDVWKLEAES